jgi:hypothetical protein
LKHFLVLSVIGSALVALGCSQPPVQPVDLATQAPNAGAAAESRLPSEVRAPSLRQGYAALVVTAKIANPRKLQAIIKPYATNFDHIDVTIEDITPTPVPIAGNVLVVDVLTVPVVKAPLAVKTITPAGLTSGVQFPNLLASATYLLKASAYLTADSSMLISIPSSSQATVVTAAANSTTSVSVPIVLLDQLFDGAATGPITVTGGGFSSPTVSETIF